MNIKLCIEPEKIKEFFMRNFAVLLVLLMICGCVRIEYTGKTAEPRNNDVLIVIFSDPAGVGKKYTVLGEASVSANYREVSRDRMIAKLRDKAAECGADAIIITEQQVVFDENKAGKQGAFRSAFDQNNGQDNKPFADSIDRDYVNTDRSSRVNANGSNSCFTRIIRAQFIRY